MNLIEIIDKLKEIALSKPNINFVGEGDIYELNNLGNIDYSVFYITQQTHSFSENIAYYQLNLFYVDRLAKDNSNRLSIHSVGMDAISNILNELTNTEDVEVEFPIQFNTFNERFADECAGVFCTVTLITEKEIGLCYE